MRTARVHPATFAAAALLALAGCGARGRQPERHNVEIRNFGFAPDTLRVSPGDTIAFHNYDVVPHTATPAGTFDSDSIGAGAEWRWVVGDAGRYDYICVYHPTMRGVIFTDHPSE